MYRRLPIWGITDGMQSPIPDPFRPAVSKNDSASEMQRGPRPPALKPLIVAEVILAIAGLVLCDGTLTQLSVMADFVTYGIMTPIWFVILSHVWRGKNWARIVTIIFSGFAILSLLGMSEYNLLQKIFTIVNAAVSVVWLWFLFTKPMIEFCKGRTTS
jgi:hypothetical protein